MLGSHFFSNPFQQFLFSLVKLKVTRGSEQQLGSVNILRCVGDSSGAGRRGWLISEWEGRKVKNEKDECQYESKVNRVLTTQGPLNIVANTLPPPRPFSVSFNLWDIHSQAMGRK